MAQTLILFLCLLAMSFNACYAKWWSLGVVKDLSERVVESTPCNSLSTILNGTQQNFCNYNQKVINSIAIGARRGILACQDGFENWRWNCTTFTGDYLFGSFVSNDTRETAAINALLASGALWQLGHDCRDEKLPNCTCKHEGDSGLLNGSFYLHDCSVDIKRAYEIFKEFLRIPNVDASGIVAVHNHDVGSKIVGDRYRKCRCTGFSGSCSINTCYYASPDMETVGEKVRTKYSASIQVTVALSNNTVQPVVSRNGVDHSTELVYVNRSPTFCNKDSNMGILGTVGRQCSTKDTDTDSCDIICCGRGHTTTYVDVPKECCEFVYCCRIECSQCGVERVATHYCN